MTKSTFAEILEEYSLPSDTTRPEAIKHLRAIQKANHPDSRGGNAFEDDHAKAAYLRATTLMERLAKKNRRPSGQSLVASGRGALAILKEQTARHEQQLALVRADQSKERARVALEKAATRHLQVLKFNSWGLGALAIVFAALKDQVAGLEKYLGPAGSSELGLSLFLMGSVLALFGVAVQLQESVQSTRATAVLTDDGIREILLALTDESGALAEDTVSLDLLIDRVRGNAGIYDYAAAQGAAEAIVDRLLVRDLISPVPGRSFSPKYKLSPELMSELVVLGTSGQRWKMLRSRGPLRWLGVVRW